MNPIADEEALARFRDAFGMTAEEATRSAEAGLSIYRDALMAWSITIGAKETQQ